MTINRILLAVIASYFAMSIAFADDIALREDHPDRYVVIKGDTLWDISARFLETPWRWPEVWSFNPQIKNPHLIYPGDVVSLVYDEFGKPMLKVERGQPTLKMAPQVRAERVDAPIQTIPLNAIQQFLGQPRVITDREIKNSAYIVATEERHLIAGEGDTIYVRGLLEGGDTKFSILRIGQPYRDPDTNKLLGYEAIHVADSKVKTFGDPSTLVISESQRETLVGDRVVPRRQDAIDQTFIPHAPEIAVEGKIIAVVDGVSRIGRYQTIVINRGERNGIETGHVLAVYQSGGTVRDKSKGAVSRSVNLPDVKTGIILVIRAHEKVSYALVMESESDMKLFDFVRNPTP